MTDAFDRLSGGLAHYIVHDLKFKSLHRVQELATHEILDGKNCVILAATAGGKTESAFFPTLTSMDLEDWRPVSVLYLSPIRALLNNQEERLQRLSASVGRRAFKWHGDTSQGERARFLSDPADVLLTTPESLEAMLISPRVPTGELFAGLRTVIIDEVHAFANDDRGSHLSSVLERLSRYCKRDIQRIGLSATVGNPEEILSWLSGVSERRGVVISPPKQPKEPQLKLDYVGDMQNAATMIAKLHPGQKRLVFVDSRRGVEDLGNKLLGQNVMAYVAHGSLSAAARRDAEEAFAQGRDCVIVATSALELGIDVGDLDQVLQVNSPNTVASFLQRMGRTGRRDGVNPNCTFLTLKDDEILKAAALLGLHRSGFVEPVVPSRRASHILAQQIMAMAVQFRGVPRSDWWAWLDGATPYSGLTRDERESIVEHMLANDILTDHDGKLWLGKRGELKYGRANFSELYAVFDGPRLITVFHQGVEIGTVDAYFLMNLDMGKERSAFVLAGFAWELTFVDWERGKCNVKKADHAYAPRWFGPPRYYSYELCQEMRRLLITESVDPAWSQRTIQRMHALRMHNDFLADSNAPIVQDHKEILWFTYAGGMANNLLARFIESELGDKVSADNQRIKLTGDAGKSVSALHEVIQKMRDEGRPNKNDALRLVPELGKQRVSKFQPCLPEKLLNELVAERVFDVAGARRVVGPSDKTH
ncbi:MAG: DEAD/DEAH box helicase [Polyangiaceae bacterium]